MSNCEKPRARIVPISRVRALTAANIVLAEANIAPKVRKTAIRVPAPLRKMLDMRLLGEILGLGHGAEPELGLGLDRLLHRLEVVGRRRAELDARDAPFAGDGALEVRMSTQTSLSASLPPAVNRPTTR